MHYSYGSNASSTSTVPSRTKPRKLANDEDNAEPTPLPVALGHALQLILLLDRVRVGRLLRAVSQLVGQALGHGLDRAEGREARAGGDHIDGRVHAADRADVHGLAAHRTGAAHLTRVLARAAVLDGID